jgi:hypothetical protein
LPLRLVTGHDFSRAATLTLLGETCVDVYLNGNAFWSAVPINVWNYTLGGDQVLKKWLSYREFTPDPPSPPYIVPFAPKKPPTSPRSSAASPPSSFSAPPSMPATAPSFPPLQDSPLQQIADELTIISGSLHKISSFGRTMIHKRVNRRRPGPTPHPSPIFFVIP